MRPEYPREEILRPDEERFRMAAEVMEGEAFEQDQRFERRIRELAQLAEPGREDDSGGGT